MIDSFLKFLTYEKRASEYTITSYKKDLSQFSAFLRYHAPNTNVIYASHEDIRAWIVDLISRKNTARTVNRKVSTLRSFFKFLHQRGHIKKNPTHKVKALKAKYPLPSFVQVKEIFNLLDVHDFPSDFPGLRDRLLIELFYGTGMRLSEMTHLRSSQVYLEEKNMKIEGKGKKERIIPCYDNLLLLIKKYISEKRKHFGKESDYYLLVTNKGEQCYPMMVYRTVRKYLDQFTTIDKRSPHVLRHTFATHLLDNGADLNAIKDLLGHASLAATQIYTHNSLDQLKQVFEKAHPKA